MPHLMEVLELLVSGQTLLLGHGPVDSDGREVLVHKQLSQGHVPLHVLHKNHNLVELLFSFSWIFT